MRGVSLPCPFHNIFYSVPVWFCPVTSGTFNAFKILVKENCQLCQVGDLRQGVNESMALPLPGMHPYNRSHLFSHH